jgi:hypothetical protein
MVYVGDNMRDWQPYEGCPCGHHQTMTVGTGSNTTYVPNWLVPPATTGTIASYAEFSDNGYEGRHRA